MTNFEDAVVDVLLRLESGDVVTYGEIAAEAGYPGAARAVGTILRTSDADLPWWRVVGSGGHIRTPNPDRQVRLLTDEGVLVRDGRVRRRTTSGTDWHTKTSNHHETIGEE